MARAPRAPIKDEHDAGNDKPVFDENGGDAYGDGVVDPNQVGRSGGDSSSGGGDQSEVAPKKRRGRRSKAELEAAGEGGGNSGKSGKKGDLYITADMIAGTLMLANNSLAGMIGAPTMFLEQKEADVLAPPIKAILTHYGYGKIAAKYGVWGNLFLALGMVYGPKVKKTLGNTPDVLQDARGWQTAPNAEGVALMGAFG